MKRVIAAFGWCLLALFGGTASFAPYAYGASAGSADTSSPNYQGLWWNAPAGSESGWGIGLAHQGDVIVATWFTYDALANDMWLVMAAPKTASGAYTGTLYRLVSGPSF